MGRKKLPMYKIVAADSRAPRDGRFIESLGTYNPNINPIQIEISESRILHWLKTGAKPTYTVKNLLSRKGILLKMHLQKKGADEQKINEEFSKWSAMQGGKLTKETEKRLLRKEKKKKSKSAEGTPPGKVEQTEQPADDSTRKADQSATPSQ
jgi:small subunit ribosomal protein S16